jgi:hypothetical protein
MEPDTIGIDLGKTVFHIVGLSRVGEVVVRRKFSRTQLLRFTANLRVRQIGMEACGGSHFLGGRLREQGHEVRLMPAQYVKPYVKTNKNDYVDAEAIAEAASQPETGRRVCAGSGSGFADTSLQDLERATGVNKSGLYAEFQTKKDLFLACLRHSAHGTAEERPVLGPWYVGWATLKKQRDSEAHTCPFWLQAHPVPMETDLERCSDPEAHFGLLTSHSLERKAAFVTAQKLFRELQ